MAVQVSGGHLGSTLATLRRRTLLPEGDPEHLGWTPGAAERLIAVDPDGIQYSLRYVPAIDQEPAWLALTVHQWPELAPILEAVIDSPDTLSDEERGLWDAAMALRGQVVDLLAIEGGRGEAPYRPRFAARVLARRHRGAVVPLSQLAWEVAALTETPGQAWSSILELVCADHPEYGRSLRRPPATLLSTDRVAAVAFASRLEVAGQRLLSDPRAGLRTGPLRRGRRWLAREDPGQAARALSLRTEVESLAEVAVHRARTQITGLFGRTPIISHIGNPMPDLRGLGEQGTDGPIPTRPRRRTAQPVAEAPDPILGR
jgi:hypothetical protein